MRHWRQVDGRLESLMTTGNSTPSQHKTSLKVFFAAVKGVNKTQILGPLAPDENINSLLDPEVLQETFANFYESTTAQIANRYLLTDNDIGVEVMETQAQNRLQLHGYGLWLTEAILLWLAINSVVLSYLFKRAVISRDPGTITGVATILARSQQIVNNLVGSGLTALKTFQKTFCGDTFHTNTIAANSATRDAFCIHQSTKSKSEKTEMDFGRHSDFTWYHPFIVTIPGWLCIIVIAVLIIAALEAVYQVSSRDHGFVTFTDHQYKEYAWRLVPATVLVLFGLLYSALDFELKTFQPFSNLKRGSVSSERSIDENYLGLVGFYGLWVAARKRHYCLVATFMGTLSTQFLTIIVAGLFTSQDAVRERTIQLRQLDHIAMDAFNDINCINYQTTGMMAATLVLDEGMDLPRWTYDSFVVPTIDFTTQPHDQNDYESVQVTVPATRAVANCTQIHPSKISFSGGTEGITQGITVHFDTLSPCGNDTTTSTTIDDTDVSSDFAFWNDRSGDLYHCPEYLVVAGNLNHRNSSWKPLALHCQPYIETLDARIDLTYPDLLEVRTPAPSLDESSRAFATTAEIPGIGRNLFAPYTKNSKSGTLFEIVGTHYAVSDIKILLPDGGGTVDGFFGTIVERGAPLGGLTADVETLAAAVEDLFPRVVAQVLNLNRVPAAAADDAVVRDGMARLERQLRLTQNGASTRVLQALLAVMALSTAVTFALGSLKRVLPKNPRSVAAVASLLAGSSLLEAEVVPPGSEWCGDKELSRLGLFKNLRFSMGWWSRGNGGLGEDGEDERFGIDIETAVWHEVHAK